MKRVAKGDLSDDGVQSRRAKDARSLIPKKRRGGYRPLGIPCMRPSSADGGDVGAVAATARPPAGLSTGTERAYAMNQVHRVKHADGRGPVGLLWNCSSPRRVSDWRMLGGRRREGRHTRAGSVRAPRNRRFPRLLSNLYHAGRFILWNAEQASSKLMMRMRAAVDPDAST